MAQDNVTMIIDTLSNALSAESPQLVRSYLNSFVDQLQNYLNALENFYINLESQARSIIEVHQEAGATDETISYALFKTLDYSDVQINDLLKTGYALLDSIRSFFTKEEITYQIGVEYRGVLYENSLTIEELLQLSSAQFNTRTKINNIFKLRMTGSKESLKNFLESKGGVVATKVSGASSLYSAIRRYTYLSTDGKTYNKGNAYEVYRKLLSQRGGNNDIPPEVTADEIVNAFNEVRKNTASSLLGGDVNLEQDKFFSSAPSLITTSLIRSTMKELISIFNSYINSADSGAFRQKLRQLFVKDLKATGSEIEEIAREKAIKEINNIVVSLKLS